MDLNFVAIVALAAGGPPAVGHVVTPRSSATFSESSVFSSAVSLSSDKDGNWVGRVGERHVEFDVSPDTVLGEPAHWIKGPGTQFVVVHHDGKWFAKGAIFGVVIRVIYPDGVALDGWKQFKFDGIAARANPPFIPFVFALWAAQADTQGRQAIDLGDSGSGADATTHDGALPNHVSAPSGRGAR